MAQDLIIPQNMGQLSTHFQGQAIPDDLGEGIVGGFAVLKYRGKVFRLQHKGTEHNFVDERGNPLPDVEVIIIKAANHLSKIYYKDGFQDGASTGKRPDCYSSNAIAPDAAVLQPVHPVCASCPMNVFGSRITEAGKPGKACSDHKRLVIVPLQDPYNEVYGGPILLRIPAASLGDLQTFSQKIKAMGWPYYAIGVRIQFDVNEAYPKLKLSAIRALADDEAAIVMELQNDPRTHRILNEEVEAIDQGPVIDESGFEQPPTQPAPNPPQPRPAPATAAPRPAPAARPQPASQPQQTAPQAQPAPQPAQRPATPLQRPRQAAPVAAQAPQAQPATTPQAAAPSGFGGAPRAAAPPPVQRAGGFGRTATPVAPQTQAPQAPAPQTISAAVAQPAARPATTRTARPAAAAPPPPPPQPVQEAEQYADEDGGDMPEGLDEELQALLG